MSSTLNEQHNFRCQGQAALGKQKKKKRRKKKRKKRTRKKEMLRALPTLAQLTNELDSISKYGHETDLLSKLLTQHVLEGDMGALVGGRGGGGGA